MVDCSCQLEFDNKFFGKSVTASDLTFLGDLRKYFIGNHKIAVMTPVL